LASEKAKLIDRILSSAVLDSSAAHDLGPTEQTNGAEESHDQGQQARPPSLLEQPYEQASTEAAYRAPTSFAGPVSTVQTVGAKKSRRRPRLSPLVVAVLAGVFFVSTLGTGLLALNRNEVAGQWRQQDQTEVAGNHVLSTHNHVLSTHNQVLSTRNQVLSTNLVSARSSITSLDSQRSKLSGQVTSLTTQLSAVANAKAKALDQNALLIQLTNQAGTVSNELSTCVDDMDSLITEIDNVLSDLSYNDPYLQSNADAAGQICSTAQQDNQTLQATLSGTG
jgi:chromosome segregation ATPase